MKYLFKTNFYVKFKSPNSDELISKIEEISLNSIDNDRFGWGHSCLVDKIPLISDDWIDLLGPNLDILSEKLKYRGGYNVSDPWLNVYSRHYHQEVHDHCQVDLSLVFFPHEEKDFSKFYFKDRNNINLSPQLQSVLDYRDAWLVSVKPGDIMFFPGSMLHGVSPHKSDKLRKTLSANLKLI